MATRKKKAKVRDEALANIDDGCDSWLVEGARFDGALEPFAAPPPRRSRRRSS